jgi:hypothetical protein
MLPTKFQFIWPRGFRGDDFKKSVNQKQELHMAAMYKDCSFRPESVNKHDRHRQFLFLIG